MEIMREPLSQFTPPVEIVLTSPGSSQPTNGEKECFYPQDIMITFQGKYNKLKILVGKKGEKSS